MDKNLFLEVFAVTAQCCVLWQRKFRCRVNSSSAHISTKNSVQTVRSLPNQTRSTSTTNRHYPKLPNALPTSIHRHPESPATTNYDSTSPITTQHHPSQFVTTNHQLSPPIITYHHPSLFTTTRHLTPSLTSTHHPLPITSYCHKIIGLRSAFWIQMAINR